MKKVTAIPSKVLLQRKSNGFTLIELLVAIAIISILAAILFPVFARARESARRASCASNVKQLALGVIMYTQDYDGAFPSYSTGGSINDEGMMPYVKNGQVYRCPSAPKSTLSYTHVYGTHYGFPWDNGNANNWVVKTANYSGTKKIDMVPDAVRTCLIGETAYGSGDHDRYRNLGYGRGQFRVGATTWGDLIPDRHLEGANYAFVDGHVKWLSKQTVDSARMNGAAGATPATVGDLPIVFKWNSIG